MENVIFNLIIWGFLQLRKRNENGEDWSAMETRTRKSTNPIEKHNYRATAIRHYSSDYNNSFNSG